MKRIVALVTVLLLAGCGPEAKVLTYPILPAELNDCVFFKLRADSEAPITVVRCPNSTTSTTMKTKTPVTTIVVDGVEYEATRKENGTSKIQNVLN